MTSTTSDRLPTIETFLSVIFGRVPQQTYIALSFGSSPRQAFPRWSYKIVHTTQLSQVGPYIRDLEDKVQCYVRLAPLKQKPTSGRGLESDSAGAAVLWVDIDCYGQTEAAIAAVKAYKLPPTLIMSTGRGISAYWGLADFVTDLEALKSRNKQLALDFKAHNGDSCYDLARVMRIPGTYNLKGEQPVLATLIEVHPERVYALQDFEPAMLDDDDQLETTTTPETLPEDFETELQEKKPKLWQRITQAAAGTSKADGNGLDHSRNDWSIACSLLTAGYTPGIVASVLMHPQWPSGEKYRRTYNTLYVLRTIAGAVRHVIGTAPKLTGERPRIYLPQGSYDVEELVDKTFTALAQVTDAYGSPVLYVLATGELCELAKDPVVGHLQMRPLNRHSLRRLVQRHITWYTTTQKQDQRPATPPDRILDTMLAKPNDEVPYLHRIVTAPTFVRNAAKQPILLDTPGYHVLSHLYYAPAPELTLLPVPTIPTLDQVEAAKVLIFQELLADFPFADDASRAHALALLLLPFVRELIDGPTPFHLIDAPIQGSGKGLCVQAALSVYFGSNLNHTSEADNDDEWRKRLLALARSNVEYLWIDNITKGMSWSSIAAALTGCSVTDRILGQSTTVTVPIRFTWVGTANNAVINDDLLRRIAYIRLNWSQKEIGEPKDLAPTVFKHFPLLAWVREQRPALIQAALIICLAGLQRGRATANKNSFEAWSQIMSTICNGIELPGFLENDHDLRQMTQDDSTDKSSDIFEAAVVFFGWNKEFTARQLADKLTSEEGVLYLPENIRNPQKFIGILFSQHRDRIVHDKYIIKRAGSKRDGYKWLIIEHRI